LDFRGDRLEEERLETRGKEGGGKMKEIWDRRYPGEYEQLQFLACFPLASLPLASSL
jgi:hypothetical protein